MRSLTCVLLLSSTCLLAGCASLGQWAKDTALAVVAQEKPKIQAALTSMKEAAIKEAKTFASEKIAEVKELAAERAGTTAELLEAKAATLRASLPSDAPMKDKVGNEVYALGALGVAQLLRMLQAKAHEDRKKERDLVAAAKGGSTG